MLRCWNQLAYLGFGRFNVPECYSQNVAIRILCFQIFPALVLSATKLTYFIPFAYVPYQINSFQLYYRRLCCVCWFLASCHSWQLVWFCWFPNLALVLIIPVCCLVHLPHGAQEHDGFCRTSCARKALPAAEIAWDRTEPLLLDC